MGALLKLINNGILVMQEAIKDCVGRKNVKITYLKITSEHFIKTLAYIWAVRVEVDVVSL